MHALILLVILKYGIKFLGVKTVMLKREKELVFMQLFS